MNSEAEGYTRITVSMPTQVAAGIKAAVDAGAARNVSALVTQLAEDHLARQAAATRIDALIGPGGAQCLPQHAHDWARQVLGLLPASDASPAPTPPQPDRQEERSGRIAS